MRVARPIMLTPDEAAGVARCSIKTIRRAYSTGVLTAYRRQGNCRILLRADDVVAWACGERVEPDRRSISETNGPQHPAKSEEGKAPPLAPDSGAGARPPKWDFSPDALRARRDSITRSAA